MDWKYEQGHIYSLDEKSKLMAEATFEQKENGEIVIDHVYVNPDLRGQAMAEKTMKAVAEFLREKGMKATAACSYASAWFQKNEDSYSDIIIKKTENPAPSCKIDGKH